MENDEEYQHSPSEFYYPEERLDENSDETSVEESHPTESLEEIEGFLKDQKSANTSKKNHDGHEHPCPLYERNW